MGSGPPKAADAQRPGGRCAWPDRFGWASRPLSKRRRLPRCHGRRRTATSAVYASCSPPPPGGRLDVTVAQRLRRRRRVADRGCGPGVHGNGGRHRGPAAHDAPISPWRTATSPGQLPLRQGGRSAGFPKLSTRCRGGLAPMGSAGFRRCACGRWHRGAGVADGRRGSHPRCSDRSGGVVGDRPGAPGCGVTPATRPATGSGERSHPLGGNAAMRQCDISPRCYPQAETRGHGLGPHPGRRALPSTPRRNSRSNCTCRAVTRRTMTPSAEVTSHSSSGATTTPSRWLAPAAGTTLPATETSSPAACRTATANLPSPATAPCAWSLKSASPASNSAPHHAGEVSAPERWPVYRQPDGWPAALSPYASRPQHRSSAWSSVSALACSDLDDHLDSCWAPHLHSRSPAQGLRPGALPGSTQDPDQRA